MDFVLSVNLAVCSVLISDHFPVKIDLRGQTSFQTLPERPYLKKVYWTHFQDHLSGRLNRNPRVDSVEDIDARLDELTNAIHEATSASAPKYQPAKEPMNSTQSAIIANIREKNRLR